MKVTRVRTFKMTAHWRNWLFVKVETDRGISGWGEGSCEGREQAVEGAINEMSANLVGTDPRQVEKHWSEAFRDGYWRVGPENCSALAALDMALWDIKGKALNAPVHELLGGPVRDRIRFYGNGWYGGAGTREEFVEAAKRTVAQGAHALKWDPFWTADLFPDRKLLEAGADLVHSIREAVGPDIELLVEVHGRLSPASAIYAAGLLEESRPLFFEEPVPPDNVDAMALVARSINIPVATGERLYTKWGFRELLEKQAAAYIQPDLTHTGGITEGKKIAAMAEVYYVPIAPHSATGPLLAAANLQLDASVPNFLIQEFFMPDIPLYNEILVENFIRMDGGCLDLPKGPGLSADLDEDALGRMEYRPLPDLGRMWREAAPEAPDTPSQ